MTELVKVLVLEISAKCIVGSSPTPCIQSCGNGRVVKAVVSKAMPQGGSAVQIRISAFMSKRKKPGCREWYSARLEISFRDLVRIEITRALISRELKSSARKGMQVQFLPQAYHMRRSHSPV